MEQELDIKAIIGNNLESFRPFFEKYTLILRGYGLKFICDEDVVKDVVQDTMVRFWERRHRFDNMPSVISFLFVTVKNALLDELRHRKVATTYVANYISSADTQQELVITDEKVVMELYRRLEMEVANLPRRTQEIIRLKLAGFQMMEIAEMLDVGRETVKTLQRCGMQKLHKAMMPLQGLYYNHIEDIAL